MAAICEIGISASLREIARRAGVTPGLINHHFGSRDQLIRETIQADLSDLLESKVNQAPQHFISEISSLSDNRIQFLRQVLIGDGIESNALFEIAFEESKKVLSNVGDEPDLEVRAALMTSAALGSIVFLPHMQKALKAKNTKELFEKIGELK